MLEKHSCERNGYESEFPIRCLFVCKTLLQKNFAMSDERSKFIYRFLNKLDVDAFFDSLAIAGSVKQLNYQIR
jgi:hypothetical protein